MRAHPGCEPLDRSHLLAVRRAIKEWRGDGAPESMANDAPGFLSGQDPILARLLWLEFWIGWAFDHCKCPVFENH